MIRYYATTFAILLVFVLNAQRFELRGLVFGIGGSGIIQQSDFVDTDFSGITNWNYQRRLQWSADIRAKYLTGNRWQFGFACGIMEAGWNRSSSPQVTEPYITQIQYSFLYSYLDLSVGRTLFLGLPQFVWQAGISGYNNILKNQLVTYDDGSRTKSISNVVVPSKFVMTCNLGADYRIFLGNHLIMHLEYKARVGLSKFHERIIAETQIHHSLALNIYFAISSLGFRD